MGSPGQRYSGTRRVAYVPDDAEGQEAAAFLSTSITPQFAYHTSHAHARTLCTCWVPACPLARRLFPFFTSNQPVSCTDRHMCAKVQTRGSLSAFFCASLPTRCLLRISARPPQHVHTLVLSTVPVTPVDLSPFALMSCTSEYNRKSLSPGQNVSSRGIGNDRQEKYNCVGRYPPQNSTVSIKLRSLEPQPTASHGAAFVFFVLFVLFRSLSKRTNCV